MSTYFEYKKDFLIWRTFKNGSKEAFDYIYSQYYQIIYNYGRHLTKDDDLIKDCIQNLFIELWKQKDHLNSTNNIKYYLLKAIRRKIVNALIHKRKFTYDEVEKDYEFEIILPRESYLIQEQIEKEDKEKLQSGLNALSKRQKEVIYLRFYEQFSYEEIAETLKLNIRTVYNIVSKAIEVLRRRIHELKMIVLMALFFF